MNRWLILGLVVLTIAAPVGAAEITGQYVEARTCDIWTGPCFANAEMNLSGKHALLAWKIDRGTIDGVILDGLGVAAVVAASDTLGLEQTGTGRAVLIVDSKASDAQRAALVRFVHKQAGELVRNIVGVQKAEIDLSLSACKEGGCAHLRAGEAYLETRCFDHKHDKACGNESAFYPPLATGVKVLPAVAAEHGFSGKGLNETWKETDRRGAYVGSFQVRY